MTDRPNVRVKHVGGSEYRVYYQMYSPDQQPTGANATVKPVLEFSAKAGSSEFHDVSKTIPGGISVTGQKTDGNTHVVTVTCQIDPTKYIE